MPSLKVWNLYRLFLRPLLFRFDAETVHHFIFKIVQLIFRIPLGKKFTRFCYARGLEDAEPVQLAGLELRNPIGLAAGFDKNAVLVSGIDALGFGFIEIGTITPKPQSGNPKPRLFRIPEKRAIINKMGFNNDGAETIAARLTALRDQIKIPVGVNIGKNRDTPNSDAVKDYDTLFKTFKTQASYFVVNISSPNTPGLRDLQSEAFVKSVGERVLQHQLTQPVFVKLAPDVALDNLEAICQMCGVGKPFSGLILTNTIPTDLGGLSGFPLKGPSTAMLKTARMHLSAEIPVISVGGIETVDDVLERFRLGANAVQIYSSLIYQGPSLPGRLVRELNSAMRNQGIRRLQDLREI